MCRQEVAGPRASEHSQERRREEAGGILPFFREPPWSVKERQVFRPLTWKQILSGLCFH